MSENKKDIANNDTPSKKSASSGKNSGKGGSFWSKIGKFFREYRSELKKISWPTFAEVLKNTAITLVVVAILGVMIWLFDWGVSALRDTAIVAAKNEDTTEVADTNEDDTTGDASSSDAYADLLGQIASDSDTDSAE